ncbi:MAG: efflux RND transporter periplasmic adaptor subunit [Flavobacteriaceae bacterium]|nr:efflux RND transporter periplasmic adaptor subunit [Flavobacteriaceae bacterium]
MKKLIPLISLIILIASCGDGKKKSVEEVISEGNIENIRLKRAEITKQKDDAINNLKQIDEAIARLDTVKKLPLVTVHAAKDTVFNHYLELQGNVTTKNMVVIYPEYSGILTRVYVKEGQKVSKGQVLAKIDDGGLSQQIAQMQIQADLAKTTYERQKRLWEQKIGSEIQYLQAKSQYEAQEKTVAQLKSQLEKTIVRAPFSGVIDDVITEQGSVVAPGQSQLIRIVNLDNMYIEAEVPESYIPTVTIGKEVEVFFPVLNKKIDAKVRQVGNYINPNNRAFKIEVSVPNNNKTIKPNLTAKLKVNDYTSKDAILIPLSIISEDANGDQYVYLAVDEDSKNIATAKRVVIETGKTQGNLIEVLKGIESGNAIIEEGARSVRDNQKIQILK